MKDFRRRSRSDHTEIVASAEGCPGRRQNLTGPTAQLHKAPSFELELAALEIETEREHIKYRNMCF